MRQKFTNLSEYFQSFWHYRDLLRLLVVRDIKLKYRRSFLGYLWSVLNPLMVMIIMHVVFSTMFRDNIQNFPVYLFCGQLMFNFMNISTNEAILSITANAPLLKKTYVPKYVFTLAKITSSLVDFVFSLGALVIVLVATRSPITPYILLAPFAILQLFLFCVGLGMFLAQANVFFRDVRYIYSALTVAWMYMTPIFYPIERLSDSLRWIITHLNPMYFYVTQFRDAVWMGRFPETYNLVGGWTAALLMLGLGVWSFMKTRDKFILYI